MEAILPQTSESTAEVQSAAKDTPVLGFWKIAFAVMVGNILTAIILGVVYAMAHS
jgi:hypothetical protein